MNSSLLTSKRRETWLTELGFRFGSNGPHAARTMMLDDLRRLLAHTDATAQKSDYAQAILEANILGKASKKARQLSLRHLGVLYSLDLSNPIFRLLRRLWPLNEAAQPLLALGLALARDPLLRDTQAFVLAQPVGVTVPRTALEEYLAKTHPDRFSAASLKSFAQNTAGTWTAAGFLQGHVRKTRNQPSLTPEALTLWLFLGYLEGRSGPRLFTSDWLRCFHASTDELERLTLAASNRGLLLFMNAGGVQEIRFPGTLSPEEEHIRQEIAHVL
jgi:hypothetical protein